MARLLPIVLAIPTFGTYGLDTLALRPPNRSDGSHSDSEDDSTRSSQPSGWDGWYKIRSFDDPLRYGDAANQPERKRPANSRSKAQGISGATRSGPGKPLP